MTVNVRCPACDTKLLVPERLLGKKVRCGGCDRMFTAGAEADTRVTAPDRRPGFARAPRRPDEGYDRPRPRRRDEDDEDSPRRAGSQRPQGGSALPWVVGGVAAGAVLLVVLTAVVALVAIRREKALEAEALALAAKAAGDAPVAPEGEKVKEKPKEEKPAPKVEAPKEEKPKVEEAKAPPRERRGPAGQLSPEALKRLKGAAVFIKVDAGRLSCTGSGFLCKVQGDTGYLVTNHHVVNPEAELLRPVPVRRGRSFDIDFRVVKYKAKGARVSAVFNSGTRDERVLPAEVLATDESRDLAVLRVKGFGEWPKPITLDEKVKPVETMQVYILGFPFGESLALRKGNPGITINKGSVSSLRENEYGQMKAVQIDGAVNPGNSGGPVVDEDGNLLGVAVATIKGAGIGLAIAPDELTRMFQGRVGGIALKPKKVDSTAAEYDVTMKLIDPMGQVRSASVLYKAASAPGPKLAPDASGAFPPLEGARRVDLTIKDQEATGSFTVSRGKDSNYLVVQTCYVNGSGKAAYTQAVSRTIQPVPVVSAPPGGGPGSPPAGGGLGGGAGTVGDVSFEEVKVKAEQVPRHLVWAPDGKSFYALEKDTGVLRRIAVPGFKEVRKLDLKTPCSWMTLSAQGLVVAANATQEVYVVDSAALTVKRKMSAPRVTAVASAPGLSVAFASTQGGFPGDAALSVLDLRKGAIARQYKARDLTTKLIGFDEPTLTPDGKYLFTRGGLEQLHRFKVRGSTLTYEQSSARIAQNGQAIEVSPDSKWVSLPSGGGNYDAGPYGTFIYSVKDLANAALTVTGGAYPRAMGFDPKMGYVYTSNFTSQLIIFTTKGVKLKEIKLPGGGEVKQFVTHPAGGSLLLLTQKKLFYVKVKKE